MPSGRKRNRTIRTFLDTYGPGPWICVFCGGSVSEITSRPGGGNVHHIDHDKTNDDPRNLVMTHHSCHSKYHALADREKKSARLKQEWADGVHFYRPQSAEVHKRQADSLRGRKLSPEALTKRSKTIKGRPLSDTHRAAIKASWVIRKAKAEALRQHQQGEIR